MNDPKNLQNLDKHFVMGEMATRSLVTPKGAGKPALYYKDTDNDMFIDIEVTDNPLKDEVYRINLYGHDVYGMTLPAY